MRSEANFFKVNTPPSAPEAPAASAAAEDWGDLLESTKEPSSSGVVAHPERLSHVPSANDFPQSAHVEALVTPSGRSSVHGDVTRVGEPGLVESLRQSELQKRRQNEEDERRWAAHARSQAETRVVSRAAIRDGLHGSRLAEDQAERIEQIYESQRGKTPLDTHLNRVSEAPAEPEEVVFARSDAYYDPEPTKQMGPVAPPALPGRRMPGFVQTAQELRSNPRTPTSLPPLPWESGRKPIHVPEQPRATRVHGPLPPFPKGPVEPARPAQPQAPERRFTSLPHMPREANDAWRTAREREDREWEQTLAKSRAARAEIDAQRPDVKALDQKADEIFRRWLGNGREFPAQNQQGVVEPEFDTSVELTDDDFVGYGKPAGKPRSSPPPVPPVASRPTSKRAA